jgi:hypothetical protein
MSPRQPIYSDRVPENVNFKQKTKFENNLSGVIVFNGRGEKGQVTSEDKRSRQLYNLPAS